MPNPIIEPFSDSDDKPDLLALEIFKRAMEDADGQVTALSAEDDREQVIEKAQLFLCRLGPHKHFGEGQCSICWFDILCELIGKESKWVAGHFRKRYLK